MDIQAQVLGVTQGFTSTGKQKWTVAFSNGQSITAWDYGVANKAQQAVGAGLPVTARVVEKPNPRGGAPYKNLQAIFHAGEVVPADLSPQPVQGAQFPHINPAGAQGATGGFSGGMSPEREVKIVKQSMTAAAANLVGHVFAGAGPEALKEAEEHVARIARTWFSEVFGNAAAPVVAAEPQAVAQFVAEQAGQPLVAVGTETVTPPQIPAALPWTAA